MREKKNYDQDICYNLKNILCNFKYSFNNFYEEIYKLYLNYIENIFTKELQEYSINDNLNVFIQLYEETIKVELLIINKYFELQPKQVIEKINILFIHNNYEIIENSLIDDIQSNTFKYTQEFFTHHFKIFENLDLLNSISHKCIDILYNTTIHENNIYKYIKIRTLITEKFNSNYNLIQFLNSIYKNIEEIEKELVITICKVLKNESDYVCIDLIDHIDKELFDTYFITYFSKNLLKNNVNLDYEYSIINKLYRFNLDCVSISIKMIKDIVVSNSLKNELNTSLNLNSIEVNTKFITNGIWPIKNNNNLQCKTFEPIKNKIETFYKNKYTDIQRNLTWNYNLISCSLQFNEYSITVKANLVDFLMEFNENSEINIFKYKDIDVKDLVKLKLISIKDNSYILNKNFNYKKKTFKIK